MNEMHAMGRTRDDDVTRRRRDAMMRRISFVRARAFSCARSRRRAISTESSSSSASSASWTPRQHDSDGDSERARGTNGRRPWTLMEFARARRSEEMPLGDAARAIGEALAPMATAAGTAAREAGRARGGRRRRNCTSRIFRCFCARREWRGIRRTCEVCWCTMRGNRG